MKIVHISDIHVSSIYYVEEWGNALIEHVERLNPSLLIISGDLTMEGYHYEFEIAKEYIDRLECENKLIVPGNHDARNVGYKSFEEFFGSRFPSYMEEGFYFQGIDSSEPDINDGHIGRENYPLIKRMEGDFKVVVLHHHLIPIPDTGREWNIPVDAGDFLKVLVDERVDMVLTGHKHKSWLWDLNGILFLTAGTATTKRLKGPDTPSFNLIEIDRDIIIKRVETISGKDETIYVKRRK